MPGDSGRGSPSTRTVTGSPASRTWRASWPRPDRPGCGARAGPFLGHRRPRLALAGELGALGALGELDRPAVALVEGEADQPGDRGDREHDEIVPGRSLWVANADEDDHQRGEDRARHAAPGQSEEPEMGHGDERDQEHADRVG